MFKEIKANFEVKSKKLGYHYRLEIERFESGCFHYGDHSAHSLTIHDYAKHDEIVGDRLYDTRYDGISTAKEKWVKVWKDFIKEEWRDVSSVELLDYEEKEVEEND